MNNVMDQKSCILCCNQISRNENTFTKASQLESKNWHGDPLKSQLKTIFFLRKILEIPQDICCTFLLEYGDPCSWVGCCDSCSVLIENSKHIFDQIIMLQKQFKALQNDIKDKIIAIKTKVKFHEDKGGVEKIIRSYVSKVNTFPKEEDTEDEFFHSDSSAPEFSCSLFLTTANASNIIVKNEVDDIDVYPDEITIKAVVGDYNSEESDPLRLNSSEKLNDNNKLDLKNEEETQHLQIILPKLEPEFHTEDIEMNLSSIIFHDESEAENSRNCPQTENETKRDYSATNQKTAIKPHECLICGKCFGDSKNLNRHIRLHTGEKPFKCNVCGKTFTRCSTMTIHQRTHTGEKQYKCEICGKTFAQSGSLARHKKVHTREWPFNCNICGKHFSNIGNLKGHERIHNGEKPFECKFCGKGFSHSSHLTVHERIHTGEKPFACEYCGKAFYTSYKLRKHSNIHSRQNYLAPGCV